MNTINAQSLEPESTKRACPSRTASPAHPIRFDTELHAFGVDAEDRHWLTVTERCRGETLAPQRFPFDERGVDALADRLAHVAGHVKVCIGTRDARAIDVATRLTRDPRVDLLLLFECERPARADGAASIAHSHELAIRAERAI